MSEQRIQSKTAVAPAKVILFGEHAINRGEPALSAAVGLYARCTARCTARCGSEERIIFRSGSRTEWTDRESVRLLVRDVNDCRDAESYETIRRLARNDYFSPQKYILGCSYADELPMGLELEWQSDVPASSGLGSGGSAFVAMVAAVSELLKDGASIQERARRAHLGDVVAHGGVASGLDTQTSLLGGVIRYSGEGLAETVRVAAGLSLVIGNTGVEAATGEVNGRVGAWLEWQTSRIKYLQAVGALSRVAAPALERGDWNEVGRLMTLNQLVLEKIGVSTPESDRLIHAALDAGALGAKVSGSGGGGIMIALTTDETRHAVSQAIVSAGGIALSPPIAVGGVHITHHNH